MIEQTMVFAAGFLVAGLLALLFLPALWRRALRLSRRRLEMHMPLSMDEIVAERDQLRAEFASDRRQIEQAHEALQQARAKDMAELGRRKAAIAALEDECGSLRTQLSAAISHTKKVQAQAQLPLDVLSQAQQLEISALQASLQSLRLANLDLEGELARARSGLEQAKAALAIALTDLEAARSAGGLRRGSDSAALKDASAEGDDLLRKAIAELGAEMLRVASPRKSLVKGALLPPKTKSASGATKPDPRRAAAGE